MTNNNFYQASCGVKRQIVPNNATSKAIIRKIQLLILPAAMWPSTI